MNRVRFLLLAGVVLGGLGGCAPEELGQIQGAEQEVMTASDVRVTPLVLGSEMEMVRDDSVIRVGQDLDLALTGAFVKPARATRLTELPPGLDASFEVEGWETYRESLALVAKDERVVLALYQIERADEDLVRQLQEEYLQRYEIEPVTVETPRVLYRFWQSRGVRLMTVESEGRTGLSLTIALGMESVMDGLRMDYNSAVADAESAESLLSASDKVEGSSATNGVDGASE